VKADHGLVNGRRPARTRGAVEQAQGSLQQLADRLQAAYTDAVADPARTEASTAALLERKEAGQ
jgi:hypothetical protein